MESSQLLKNKNLPQVLLAVVFAIYLIMGYKTPEPLASFIDTIPGKLIVLVIFVSLFYIVNPVLGVLGLLVAFQLIRSSSFTTGTYAVNRYVPSEYKKSTELSAFNQFPYTLEQEVVTKMTPQHKIGVFESSASYKPVLDNVYDAQLLTAQN